jgi:GNAT superfamily N-acetyltransferase
MEIILTKANIKDAAIIHKMQIVAFKSLLDKYHDYEISPGAEPIEKVEARLQQSYTDYYLISLNGENVGAIRIVLLKEKDKYRISPIFILPEYQNKGIAQKVFSIIENMYQPACGWELDTILEEKGNCYLYEKMGYKKTGKYEKINENMNIVFYEKN